jgi:Skp family chaperone for outer membrane proteins
MENISDNENISVKILCVDMDKVFNLHPKTQKYKKEIKDFAKTRKTVIEEMVKEFNSIAEQVKSINLKLSEAQTLKDEKLIGEFSKQFEDVQNLLKEQKLKIADLSDRTKNEIALMEEKNTASVLEDIESLIKKKSRKYNADIVLDKHSILTGKCKDITNEVIKMLKDM